MVTMDTTGIQQGDTITQEACEQAIGFTEQSDPKSFQFSLLQLMGAVSDQLKRERGRDLTLRIIGSTIYVLTDAEAAEYNPKRFEAGLRLARRAHRRLMAVNTASLNAEQRESHMKAVMAQAHKLSMLRKREELPLESKKATTPKMVFSSRMK